MSEPEIVAFGRDDVGEVVGRMAGLAGGSGWVNLQPGYDPELADPGSGGRWPFRRGPAVPVCTWVPNERAGSRRYDALGVDHGTAMRAGLVLREHGVAVPEGWSVLQDNPRRGLVVAAPLGADHEQVVRWLVSAGEVLAVVPLTGECRALVHRR